MEFSTLKTFICDDSDREIVNNILSSSVNRPALVDKILHILDDDEPYIRNIKTDRATSLYRLMMEYYHKCMGAYVDFCVGSPKLDGLMEYEERIVYKVQAPNGIRVATNSEINNGVAELLPEGTHVLSKEMTESLNLLLWSFTGMLRYYKLAGLTYTYVDNNLVENDYQLIMRAGDKLRVMVDLISDSTSYNNAINALKISKKTFKYKYPDFAEDEITPEISVKQIIYLCKTHILGKGLTENQQQAKRIVTRIDKIKDFSIKPFEIATLRKAYAEVQRGEVIDTMSQIDPAIQLLCEKIENGRKAGMLNGSDIGVKIVGTIKRTGRCSARQLEFLRQTEKKMQNASQKSVTIKNGTVQNKCNDTTGELTSIYDALGSGGFDIIK